MNEELLSRLDQLALKLGTTVDYMWPKLVSYTQMQAATTVAVTSLFTIGLTTVIVKLLKEPKPAKSDDPFDMSLGPEAVISVLAIAVAFCVLAISHHVPIILVPEVEALKTIGNILK